MATYVNNLRLKEITTSDEDGTWGTSTNANLSLITDGFSYGTKEMSANGNETFTMPDAATDSTRSFYLKITSAVALTATREVTLGPNTVSKVWLIENATSGSQTITIKQGSGATVDVTNGSKVMLVTDGAGAGAAVLNANPSTGSGSTVLSGATLNDGYTEEVYALSGTSPSLSPTNGSIQTWTLSANSSATAGTWGSGQSLTLMVDDDDEGYTINWPSISWKTNLGTAPTLAEGSVTAIQLWKVGSVLYGARVGDNA